MKRAIRLAMRLYPATWRARYGREFEALVEDVQPGGRELWDIIGGALRMQMFTWTWRKTAAAFALAGAAAAGVLAARAPNEYISTAVVRIADGPNAWRNLGLAQQDVLSRTSLAAIIQRYGLYPEERKKLPLEEIVQSMRNRYIHIAPLDGSSGRSAFSLSFQYPDRATAQQVTQDLTSRFLKTSIAGSTPIRLEVLDPASLPQSPAAPNRPAIVGVGLAVGLTLGLIFLGVRRWPLAAACGAAAAVAALAVASAIPERWMSTAVLHLDPGAEPAQLIHDTLTDENLAAIIQRPGVELYKSDRQRLSIDALVRRMRERDLRIVALRSGGNAAPRDGNAFAVSFVANDRYKAQAVVRMLVARLAEQHVAEMRQRFDKPTPGAPNLEVLDPASLPERPAEPNRLVILTLGLAVGLTGGIVVSRRRRVKALVAGAA